ncbi:MAG: ECF-type sigma factor [Planctomycetota bacterium]
MEPNSVTLIIEALKQGAHGSPQAEIVSRFMHRLEALARKRLGTGGLEDSEDIALCAINSFLMRVCQDEYDYVVDRDSLWALLTAITLHKATNAQRKELAQKRDTRRTVELAELLDSEATVELFDSMLTIGNQLLESIHEPTCREVARLRMEGYRNEEIARQLNRSVKTVERKLRLVRDALKRELGDA